MADWGGFTEEDLRELQYPGKIDMGKPPGGTPKKQANFGKQKGKGGNRDRAFSHQKKRVTLSDVVEVMPVNQMLKPESISNGDAKNPDPDVNNEAQLNPAKPKNVTTPPKSVLKPSKPIERQGSRTNSNSVGNEAKLPNNVTVNDIEGSRELDEEEAKSRELSQIQKFQHQQRLIEEKNKQTKVLLTQAIKERRARAETEAHLLTDLQKELSRLDNLLTTDVSIIRDRIETASLDYTESQKRYEKAEKEFIAAKMDLFRRADSKEKLTEHLYTIIYQNEMRKAQKLSELMEMLTLTTAGEEVEVECILPAMPPIPMYNPVQTLLSPGKPAPALQPSNDTVAANPENGGPAESKAHDDKIIVDQSVGSEISPPPSATPVESKVNQNDTNTNTPVATNGNVPSTTHDIPPPPPQSTDAERAADPSLESAQSSELEGKAEKGDNEVIDNDVSMGSSDVANDNSIPKIPSSPETNPEEERTSTDKKTTLKELAQ